MYEIIFQNSFLTLRALNLAIAIGFLFGGLFCIRYVEKHKLSLRFLTKYFLYVIVASLITGRLFYVVENKQIFIENPISSLYLWDLKFSFFGFLFGLVLSLLIFTKIHKEDFWSWIDASFLTTLAVMVFLHLGFFLSGEHYGLPTGLPWGVIVEADHIPFTTPIHPTQLYSMLLTIILLAYGVERSKRIHLSGVVGTRVMMVYALGMLGISFLYGLPSLYTKIGYGAVAALCLIATIHCSHKTHIVTAGN